jgi:hypothetical protein
MTPSDLHALGFEVHGDVLRAPDGTGVNVTVLDARCFRLVITLPNGNIISAVIAGLAIKVEEAAR